MWGREPTSAGEIIHHARERLLPALRERWGPLIETPLKQTGWALELQAHLARDRRIGQTLEGPHRAEFQARLLQALRDSGSQVFFTAIERGNLSLDAAQDALFHVEHGQVRRLPLV